MLTDLLKQGFGEEQDFNCAEKILYGANIAYNLGLDKEAMKLVGGFGGGMGIEDKCGALTASIMVLSKLFIKDIAHESDKIKKLAKELFYEYELKMGSVDCAPLKEKYSTEGIRCKKIILEAAVILDKIVSRELGIK